MVIGYHSLSEILLDGQKIGYVIAGKQANLMWLQASIS